MERHARAGSRPPLLAATQSDRTTRANSDARSAAKGADAARALSLRSASPSSSTSTSRSSTATTAVMTKKVDEILKRMLPHSIVQSYEKMSSALKTHVEVVVNGESLAALERETGPLSAHWSAQQHQTGSRKTTTSPSHPFHYARCVQYASPQPKLSLSSSFKTLQVSVSSASFGATAQWFQNPSQDLTKKSWKLLTETDRMIGLALYEIPLGPWLASSLVVLVWAKTLEVVNLYLQLHVAELLYSCPPRAIRFLPDDVDPKHGLHSYTAAISIRDFQRVFWETECYSIELPSPDGSKHSVSVGLLDEASGYRDRGRFVTTPVSTSLATEAISVSLESAIVVDFTLWDASCQPVWAFSKLVSACTREAPREASDFSVSVMGDKRVLSELAYHDSARGNSVVVLLEKPSPASTTKNRSAFVKQITLELSTAFINRTFSTDYARSAPPLGRK